LEALYASAAAFLQKATNPIKLFPYPPLEKGYHLNPPLKKGYHLNPPLKKGGLGGFKFADHEKFP